MKIKFWIDLIVMGVTIKLLALAWQDQPTSWPIKERASRLLQKSKVEDLSEYLIEISQLVPSVRPPRGKDLSPPIQSTNQLSTDRHLRRLVASGDAPRRLLSEPANRQWLEVSGVATPIETTEGLLWVGRVSGYHGPITVFALDGKILSVSWNADEAVRFFASHNWSALDSENHSRGDAADDPAQE